MKTKSAFPANSPLDMPFNTPTGAPASRKVLVWDAPVRVFHWLMVLSFAGAYLSAESERWRLAHVTLGYTMAGLVVFRILWGLAGTRYARFASFVRGPKAVARYLGSIVQGQPEHHTGHNPAGALAIVALLALTLAIAVSGWASYNEVGGNWLEDTHEAAANLMLAVIGLHVGGVVLSSWLHRENLALAMLSGRKPGTPEEGIRRAWRGVAALMLVAVLGFWWLQWQGAPSGAGLVEHAAAALQFDQPARTAG
jgi:cytochrome b